MRPRKANTTAGAAHAKANEKILKGVRARVKAGELKAASKQFSQAGRALKQTYAQLKVVPQPTADTAKLTKWLSYVKTEASLFEQTAAALKAGNKNKAQVSHGGQAHPQRQPRQQRHRLLRIHLLPLRTLQVHLAAPPRRTERYF